MPERGSQPEQEQTPVDKTQYWAEMREQHEPALQGVLEAMEAAGEVLDGETYEFVFQDAETSKTWTKDHPKAFALCQAKVADVPCGPGETARDAIYERLIAQGYKVVVDPDFPGPGDTHFDCRYAIYQK